MVATKPRKKTTRDLSQYVPEGFGRVEKLQELARNVAPHMNIVELGVNRGLTCVSMAKVATAPIWAIDLWDMRLPVGKLDAKREGRGFTQTQEFLVFQEALKTNGVAEFVTWVKGDSHQSAKLWNRPIGLLHIDAAHDYQSVRRDYQSWSKYVVPGGYLAMDDADPGRAVAKVIEEVVLPSGEWEPEPELVEGRLFVARRK